MLRIYTVGLIFAVALVLSGAVYANDTEVGSVVGNFQFLKNESISVESEKLTIAPGNIKVEYEFLNTSKQDKSITLGFPQPQCKLDEFSWDASDCYNKVPMKLTVDNKPVSGEWIFNYEYKGKLLSIHTDPSFLHGDGTEIEKLAKADKCPWEGYTEDQCREYQKEYKVLCADLLKATGISSCSQAIKELKVNYTFIWKYNFKAGAITKIQHEYAREDKANAFFLGGDVGGYHPARLPFLRDDLCSASEQESKIPKRLGCGLNWQRYVLKTGGNWKSGNIKKFQLKIEKPKKYRRVLTCFPGLVSQPDGSLFAEISNYIPNRDLSITWEIDGTPPCSEHVDIFSNYPGVVPKILLDQCRDSNERLLFNGERLEKTGKTDEPGADLRNVYAFVDDHFDALCIYKNKKPSMKAIRVNKVGNTWKVIKTVPFDYQSKEKRWPDFIELQKYLNEEK